MKRWMTILLIGVFTVGLTGAGLLLVFAGAHHMVPGATPAWGMHAHMGSMHDSGGMMQGWMQSVHNTCMAWMHGSDAEQDRASTPANQKSFESDSSGAEREREGSENTRVFKLETTIQGGFAYRGLNDSIQKQINPDLRVKTGQNVTIQVVNGDGVTHDLVIPALGLRTRSLSRSSATATLRFTPEQEGTYVYYCSVPGHRTAGMEGRIVVES